MALGMVDRSRILLCVLTFLCLSFNPLTTLLQWGGAHDADQHPHSGPGRSMLSLESGRWRAPWAIWARVGCYGRRRSCPQPTWFVIRSQRAFAVGPICLLLIVTSISCMYKSQGKPKFSQK